MPSLNVRRGRRALLAILFCALAIGSGGIPAACGSEVPTTAVIEPTASRSVDFTTEDGVILNGHLFGSSRSGVVLAHMYPADQSSWYSTAGQLAREGYMVLTFDFRGYGESQGTKQFEYLDRDVVAATHQIAAAGATRVALVGASMGGTACLVAASRLMAASWVSVAGVATLSAPVEFKGLSAAEAAPRVQAPLLFIAAQDDTGADGATKLEQLVADAGDLHIVPGKDHGTDLLKGSQASAVWKLLLGFLQHNLPAGQ
jgi:pimeloyl-ACP methyl ester carboxylesterase